MDLNRFYNLSEPISEETAPLNKYTYWAHYLKLSNYRIVTMNTVMKYKRQYSGEIPTSLIRFISENPLSVSISNVIQGRVCQTVLRSTEGKAFLDITQGFQYPYGLGQLDKTYHQPVLVVEGTLDRDAMLPIYKNTIACLTAGLSILNKTILSQITSKVILGYDNDEVGRKATWKDKKDLEKLGLAVDLLTHPKGLDDPGDLSTMFYTGDMVGFSLAQNEYKLKMRLLSQSMIGGL
jgi:hypothetical protein